MRTSTVLSAACALTLLWGCPGSETSTDTGGPASDADVASTSDAAPDGTTPDATPDGTTPDATPDGTAPDAPLLDTAPDAPEPDAPLGDPCAPNPCLNGGSCSVVSDAPSCQCLSGFSGTLCQVDDALEAALEAGNYVIEPVGRVSSGGGEP